MSKKNYKDQDLEDSLRRAFVDKGFSSILMDGREYRNKFLRNGINYGINRGWLCVDDNIEESQYTAVTYKLTEEGKKYFGLD